ncbi:AKR1B10 [Branchiostoma lanceolatum]|uniref:AKR1B10 protein n=4 Tax=Branchiostoma lanceolatum TaxID=7740 RepID=A0A8J9ZGY1_BRALA|nr:AKR1B10 [Branchiostoma lanceolatum]
MLGLEGQARSELGCDMLEKAMLSYRYFIIIIILDVQGVLNTVSPVPDRKMASGYTIPVFGLGTAAMGDKTYDAVLSALTAGYRMIDTAQAYWHSEESIGRAIRDSGIPREDIFIISKLSPRHFGRDLTSRSVDVSLRKLGTDFIDLFLIHNIHCSDYFQCTPDEPKATWEVAWKAMEELHRQGKLRSLGVSNFYPPLLEKLVAMAEVPVSLVQNWFDPFYRDEATREYCEDHGIVYQGYSTFGTQWMYMRQGQDRNPVFTNPFLLQLSETLDTPAHVANIVLRWALQKGVVVIPRSVNAEHIRNNLKVLDLELSEKTVSGIDNNLASVGIGVNGEPFLDDATWNRIMGNLNAESHDDDLTRLRAATKEQRKEKHSGQTESIDVVNREDETVFIGSDGGRMYALDGVNGHVKWTFTSEEDLGSTAAFSPDQSVLYFGSENSFMYALRVRDGQVVWTVETGPVRSSCVVGWDGTVYVGTLDNQIYAIRPDGMVKWSRDLGGEIWGRPAIGSGGRLVYVGVMAENTDNAFALDSQTGNLVWSFRAGGSNWSSPVLSPDGRCVLFSCRDSHIYTLLTDTGHLVSTFDVGEEHDGIDSTPAVASDGTLFVGTNGGSVLAIDIERGKLKWEKKLRGEILSSPALDNEGNLYIGTSDGQVLKLKQKDGSTVWQVPAGDAVMSSPKLDAHGRVFVGSNSGFVFAINDETGQVIWQVETEGPVVASPLITAHHQYNYTLYRHSGEDTKDEL